MVQKDHCILLRKVCFTKNKSIHKKTVFCLFDSLFMQTSLMTNTVNDKACF